MHLLQALFIERQDSDLQGIPSICTANTQVIEACLDFYQDSKLPLLIEATANQVNQFGGYTNMQPLDFKQHVYQLAEQHNFPHERLILGGDHLGPLTWRHLDEDTAMKHAEELVNLFVEAGYTKIHLDTSMRLASDDPHQPLSTDTIAQRGIRLMKVCERAYQKRLKQDTCAQAPVYIIGSEVPIPGGAMDDEHLVVTSVQDFKETIEIYQKWMRHENLEAVFDRIIGVVVQPGVEFADAHIDVYDAAKAQALSQSLKAYPSLVFEGHSTDYQPTLALKEMVRDGIRILKVGPALTYALREALFNLSMIEEYLELDSKSQFIQQLDLVMISEPQHWINHYHGTEAQIKLKRKFSFSDRCRYVLPNPILLETIQKLRMNTQDVPLSLVSQFFPLQFDEFKNKQGKIKAEDLIKGHIQAVLTVYEQACVWKRMD